MWQVFNNKLYTRECFHLFGEPSGAVARRCRNGKEFVLRNMFTSRYVIIRGLSEFMTNYHRLVVSHRYIAAPAGQNQKKKR